MMVLPLAAMLVGQMGCEMVKWMASKWVGTMVESLVAHLALKLAHWKAAPTVDKTAPSWVDLMVLLWVEQLEKKKVARMVLWLVVLLEQMLAAAKDTWKAAQMGEMLVD